MNAKSKVSAGLRRERLPIYYLFIKQSFTEYRTLYRCWWSVFPVLIDHAVYSRRETQGNKHLEKVIE